MSTQIKNTVSELAYFGGDPCFEHPVHVVHASASQKAEFLEQVEGIFSRGQFTNDGPVVRKLERRIADYLNARHCIAVCNGTVGLQIAARALGMSDEVIMPSFTFIATAHALRWLNARPVFCDIDPATHAIDPLEVERVITPQTKGIIGVHIWGQPCDIDALSEISKKNGIPLVFDAAHAFGAAHKGVMVGNFGDVEVFSFHATKIFHTFEGGALVTNDADIAERARLLRNFGFVDYDRVEALGINGKMNEVCAAMGLAGLENVESTIELNRTRFFQYSRQLESVDGVILKSASATGGGNFQYVVIEVDRRHCALSRDQVLALLQAERILARRYFYPGCHKMEPYRSEQSEHSHKLPHTETVSENVLVLPTGEKTDNMTIEKICDLIKFIVRDGARIAARL